MTFVDIPDKKQKHPHYEHRTIKLDLHNNKFSSKKFHNIRKVSTQKKLIKSFGRIGMCLNGKNSESIPAKDFSKACFILVNSYENEDTDLGVGPLNDGYLVGLKHHRLGFKVFYLYNPQCNEFADLLGFFLKNTKDALTVFYSGRDMSSCGTQGIEFMNGSLSKNEISKIIEENNNGKARVMFITDSLGGGSVFDIKTSNQKNGVAEPNMITFFVTKSCSPESKEGKRSHGIFTYYFCKITSERPNITPKRLLERMNPSLSRFSEIFRCQVTNQKLVDSPIFF
ncbi:hypothetical protein M9Y10_037387 [Tritrichomonas musculus]|uniref:Caspase family p20 domain-containing protein n=1 Tax=Tritrichomonas musculus TaxID=1915356 RepID=A0ABR2GTI5_9EUKA